MKLDDRFDSLGRTRAPDLWPDIAEREPRRDPEGLEPSPARRAGIVVLAFAVAMAGFAFAFHAFRGNGPAARQTAVAPVGPGKIAFAMGNPSRVFVADPNGGNVQRLTTGNEADAYVDEYGYADDSKPTWSPDGSRIAFTRWYDGPTSLCTIGVDGTGFQVLVRDFHGGQLAWSPDGSTIA